MNVSFTITALSGALEVLPASLRGVVRGLLMMHAVCAGVHHKQLRAQHAESVGVSTHSGLTLWCALLGSAATYLTDRGGMFRGRSCIPWGARTASQSGRPRQGA